MPGRDDGRTRRRIRRSSRLSPGASSHPRRAPRRAPKPACRRCAAFRGNPRRSALFVSLTLRAPSLFGRPGYAGRMLPQVRPCCALSQLQAAISPEAGTGAIVAGMTPAVSSTGRGTLTRIGHAALVPWWTAQLLTGTKSFERNAVIGSRRLNRFGLHETRVRLAHEVAQRRRRRLEGFVSVADRAAFARDGFVVRRDF